MENFIPIPGKEETFVAGFFPKPVKDYTNEEKQSLFDEDPELFATLFVQNG